MASEAVPFPVEVLPLASAATAPLAAMPGPIVHVKGFRDRILLDGSAPPFALNMRAKGELERERQKAEAAVALVVEKIVALAPKTLAWDGDAPASTGFTTLIFKLLAKLPHLRLVAFALEDWIEGCQAAWRPVLSALPAESSPAALTFVLVPPAPEDAVGDDVYVHLGHAALVATGSRHAFCLGGGDVTAREAALAPEAFFVAPARRWVAPDADTTSVAGSQLRMEDSAALLAVAGVTLLE